MKNENQIMLSFSHAAVGYGEKVVLQDVSFQVQILPERYAYSEISGTSILI